MGDASQISLTLSVVRFRRKKAHGKAKQALPFFILFYTDEVGSWPQRVENVKQNQQSHE